MSERLFFPPPEERNKITVNLNLENYATKKEVNAITGVDTSLFAKQTDISGLKSDIRNIKFNLVTDTDLGDIKSDIVNIKTNYVKSSDFNGKVNTLIHKNADSGDLDKRIKAVEDKIPDVTKFALKTEIPDTTKFALETEIPDTSKFALKTSLPDTSKFALKTSLPDLTKYALKTDIPKSSGTTGTTDLSKYTLKTDHDKDNKDLEDKLKTKASTSDLAFTKSGIELQLLTKSNKSDTDEESKKQKQISRLINSLQTTTDKKITELEKKVVKVPDNIINEYKFSAGRNFFTGNDGYQNSLIYPPLPSAIIKIDGGKKIKEWKSTGMFDTSMFSTSGSEPTVDNNLSVKFKNTYLSHKKKTDINRGIANFYIVYKFNQWSAVFGNKYPFHNCLFGSVDDKFNGRGIAFSAYGTWTHDDNTTARNVFIFGTDNSGSSFPENRKADFTVLGVGPEQYVENKNVNPEAKFGINFTKDNKKFVLSLHYNSDESYLFVNGEEIHKFKANMNSLNQNALALGVLSKDYLKVEVKDVALDGRIYEFSVDRRGTKIEDIKNIHEYLIKKHNVQI